MEAEGRPSAFICTMIPLIYMILLILLLFMEMLTFFRQAFFNWINILIRKNKISGIILISGIIVVFCYLII